MLKKALRLRTMRDFKALHRKGRTVANKHLIAKIAQKPDQQDTRVAVVVSNKTEKSAVKRNRVKRQLREIVRKEYPSMKGGYDILFTIKSGFLRLTFDEMQKTTKDLLKKAKLFV